MKSTVYVFTHYSCPRLGLFMLGVTLWLGLFNSSFAQTINWQKALGGTKDDIATAITTTTDGGYIVAGYTASNDGDVSGNHGGASDCWVVKLNTGGDIIWKKTLGGTRDDQANAIMATSDGGYLVAGSTNSSDGDVNSGRTFPSLWVIKLNSEGTIVWQRAIEESRGLYATAITAAPNGGYVVAGYLFFQGTKPSGRFFFVLKLTESGDTVWEHYMGGTYGDDVLYAITTTADGGYVVAGKSSSPTIVNSPSPDTDHTKNHNAYDSYDGWVSKLNSQGDMVWHRFFGGTGLDYANAVKETSDGSLVVSGYTQSTNGDVTGNHGSGDAWVFKLSSTGILLWQKTVGGTGDDEAKAITLSATGDYVVAGSSTSLDGDVSGNKGSRDAWVTKLNTSGNLIWQKSLGGSGPDDASAIALTGNDGYVVAGTSQSSDGDVSANHGGTDYWVVGLREPALQLVPPTYSCATGELTFNTSGGNGSPVEFLAIGVTPWTTTRTHIVEAGVRLDPNSAPLLLIARQNGQVVTRSFDFRAICSGNNQAPVFTGPIPALYGIVNQPFSYELPASVFTDPQGRALTFSAVGLPAGLTIDANTGRISGVPAQSGLFSTSITTMNTLGASVSGPVSISIAPSGNTSVLQVVEPLYNCATGQLVFQTVGGNGSPIEFLAIGVTPWTTNPYQTVELGVRLDPNSQPLTLMARQSGVVVTYTFNFRAYCGSALRKIETPIEGLRVQIFGNPVADQTVTFDIIGADNQSVRVRLLTSGGNVVSEQIIPQALPNHRSTLPIGNTAGLYVLRIETPTQSTTARISRP